MDFQPDLFRKIHIVVSPHASEQTLQLARVEGRIAEAIEVWCHAHQGGEFHLSSMTAAIMSQTQCAPDSPRRVLSQLVKRGQVSAECIDRSKSLWRVN
jgi:hypothetical protein